VPPSTWCRTLNRSSLFLRQWIISEAPERDVSALMYMAVATVVVATILEIIILIKFDRRMHKAKTLAEFEQEIHSGLFSLLLLMATEFALFFVFAVLAK
jgi:hypothetical protein